MEKILVKAHNLFLQNLKSEDICVDMTVGNGNDTLFLARNYKFVYGFDIQEIALNNTKKFLDENHLNNYKLFLSSHEKIKEYIDKQIGGAIFNLGYLPSGDKNITTKSESTIKAINGCMALLRKGGIIVIVVYDGHENGKIEAKILEEFLTNLNQKEYDVLLYKYINQINNPPYIYCLKKR